METRRDASVARSLKQALRLVPTRATRDVHVLHRVARPLLRWDGVTPGV